MGAAGLVRAITPMHSFATIGESGINEGVIAMPSNNRVTQEEIDYLINSAQTEEAILFGVTLVVAYQFPSLGNWTIRGEGSVVDPAEFDIELGREFARKDVENKLWKHMGFVKQLEMGGQISWTGRWDMK